MREVPPYLCSQGVNAEAGEKISEGGEKMSEMSEVSASTEAAWERV